MSAKERLDEGYNILLDNDEGAQDPREDCNNLGTMVCFHRRFRFGDKHDFKDGWEFTVYLEKLGQELAVCLPVYLYDHGGQSVSTQSFIGRAHHAEWDSGKIGYIFVTKKRIREWYGTGRVTPKFLAMARAMLEAEVEYYDHWIRGDFCMFTITDPKEEHVTSLSGFPTEDEAKKAAMDFLEELEPWEGKKAKRREKVSD